MSPFGPIGPGCPVEPVDPAGPVGPGTPVTPKNNSMPVSVADCYGTRNAIVGPGSIPGANKIIYLP